jgi:hypothetical protein
MQASRSRRARQHDSGHQAVAKMASSLAEALRSQNDLGSYPSQNERYVPSRFVDVKRRRETDASKQIAAVLFG